MANPCMGVCNKRFRCPHAGLTYVGFTFNLIKHQPLYKDFDK